MDGRKQTGRDVLVQVPVAAHLVDAAPLGLCHLVFDGVGGELLAPQLAAAATTGAAARRRLHGARQEGCPVVEVPHAESFQTADSLGFVGCRAGGGV